MSNRLWSVTLTKTASATALAWAESAGEAVELVRNEHTWAPRYSNSAKAVPCCTAHGDLAAQHQLTPDDKVYGTDMTVREAIAHERRFQLSLFPE